ncbi:major facilitator superfamily domain-containing protein [Boletus reticuloceps]|uniref:Major facilitator superfamily domain-containing protein n=1 Tax=Boletus reticuloceps TaxID=495285 RepID=A0A8I2YFV2_9AGAM|nr:major facilitator superfamily domain-containing protein [Boletus reticuloceps]
MATHDTERTPLLPNIKPSKDRPLHCHQISHTTRYGILAALWAGTFLCNLNLTLVATLLPSLTSEFQGSNQASWIGTSYLFSTCTFTPLYGRLCTILGRRTACHTALLATAIGTLLCGISGNMVQLTVARFIAGMGGGAVQLLAMIVTADMYNIRDRAFIQAFISISQGLGLGLGGPIGGIMNDLFGWRMTFLCQVPLFVLVIILITRTLHYVTPGQGQSIREVLSRVDFGGCITLFLTLGSSLTWLSMKFNEDLPWTDTQVIVPLTLSVIFLVLFLVIECMITPEPVLPPCLLREKVPVLIGLSNYFVSLCNFSVMYFVPLWFQTVPLDSASIAGLHLLPDSLAMGLGSFFTGWLMRRTGKYKTINLVFGILPLCGVIPLVFLREDSGFVQKWFSVVPIGFGNAVVFQTVLIALQAHLSESQMAFGTAFGQLLEGSDKPLVLPLLLPYSNPAWMTSFVTVFTRPMLQKYAVHGSCSSVCGANAPLSPPFQNEINTNLNPERNNQST